MVVWDVCVREWAHESTGKRKEKNSLWMDRSGNKWLIRSLHLLYDRLDKFSGSDQLTIFFSLYRFPLSVPASTPRSPALRRMSAVPTVALAALAVSRTALSVPS